MSDPTSPAPAPAELTELLTLDEACRQLRIGRRTLSRLIALGRFPGPDVTLSPILRRYTREHFLAGISNLRGAK